MPQPIRFLAGFPSDRLRAELGRRATGIVAALLLELLLIALLLTLGWTDKPQGVQGPVLSTFDASSSEDEDTQAPPDEKPEPEPSARATPQPREAEPEQAQPAPPQPAPPQPAPSRPALIPVPRDQMSRFDIGNVPAKPAPPAAAQGPMMGPADTRAGSDTPRVGTAPNGQPLYAAQWYREPYDSELAGYLSTAQGPGWGLIACKTAPEYRVENCVALDEYPANSQIARAVLAAAWQFKVRPPRLGGRYMVGEWVRIRIDYGLKRK